MQVLFDAITADTIDFVVPSTPLSRGETHDTMDESIRALCAQIGFELMDYGHCMRLRVGDQVHIKLRGRAWVRNQQML
jgi:hypothetical protein